MQKRCSNCEKEYWARWRNEPVTLCPECRVTAALCTRCGEATRPPIDHAQTEMFPLIVWRAPSRIDSPTTEERYWSLRAKASQATRRKYPYC